MPDLRKCRWCRHPIAFGQNLNAQRIRPAHCPNPQCDWCRPCVDRRHAAAKAGYPLDQPVTPDEAPAEVTQELPAVRDDGEPPIDPNDQMT